MRKTSFAILLLLSTTFSGFSQPVFKNDSLYQPLHTSLLRKIDSTFHLAKNNNFEFRLYVSHPKMIKSQFFILTQKNNLWALRLFEKRYKFDDSLVEISVKQNGLTKLWKALEQNNILTMLDADELKDKDGNGIDDVCYHGTHYFFDLITIINKRSYSYYCAEGLSQKYKYIKEYKRVINIVKLLYRHCNINSYYLK